MLKQSLVLPIVTSNNLHAEHCYHLQYGPIQQTELMVQVVQSSYVTGSGNVT